MHSAISGAERKSPACEDGSPASTGAGFGLVKKQGRRRSMPPTALPAPDIEIGLRHPVNSLLPRERTGKCDPFHSRRKKSRGKPVEAPVRRHPFGGDFGSYLTGSPGALSSGGCG